MSTPRDPKDATAPLTFRELEWSGGSIDSAGVFVKLCPSCVGLQPVGAEVIAGEGHSGDCRLVAAVEREEADGGLADAALGFVARAVDGLRSTARIRGAYFSSVMAFFRISALRGRALCESLDIDPDEEIGPETIRLDADAFAEASRIRETFPLLTVSARGPLLREELEGLVVPLDDTRLDRVLAALKVMRGEAVAYVDAEPRKAALDTEEGS